MRSLQINLLVRIVTFTPIRGALGELGEILFSGKIPDSSKLAEISISSE